MPDRLDETQEKGNTMKTQRSRFWTIAGLTALLSLTLFLMPALSHHSFAMYDQNKTVTLTGVATQFVAQANHAEIHFYAVGPDGKLMKDADGKNVTWGVEMAGAAAVAQQGITAVTFGAGTVFSVRLNPLRDGSNYGSRIGAIAKCPVDAATGKPKPPAAGKHCDSVPGNTLLGGTAF
jgi:hypothetical protein